MHCFWNNFNSLKTSQLYFNKISVPHFQQPYHQIGAYLSEASQRRILSCEKPWGQWEDKFWMCGYRSTNPHPTDLVGNHLCIYPKIFTEYLLILGTVLGTGSMCSRLAMSCLRRAFFLVKVSLIKENDFSCSALPEYAGRILKLVFQN